MGAERTLAITAKGLLFIAGILEKCALRAPLFRPDLVKKRKNAGILGGVGALGDRGANNTLRGGQLGGTTRAAGKRRCATLHGNF